MTTAIASPTPPLALVDVRHIAEQLGCSQRHVWRMADGGLMPPPLRLGALVRWNRSIIEDWITQGCPKVRAR